MSEAGFGVSLLTDSKYGYSCRDHVLSLSLLRASTRPDAAADIGRHRFRYSIYPHADTSANASSRVVEAAAAFNSPLIARSIKLAGIELSGVEPVSYFSVNKSGVILETVKRSEDRSDELVLRLYEAYGGRGRLTVSVAAERLGLKITSAALCNLLEDDDTAQSLIVSTGNNGTALIECDAVPFQIITIKLRVSN